MILEERCYTLAPGNIAAFWACYTPEVIAVMEPVRANMLGYFISDTGTLNQIVHLWRYTSYEERSAKRDALAADKIWQQHLARLRKLCITQETRMLRSSPVDALCPLAGPAPLPPIGSPASENRSPVELLDGSHPDRR